MSAKDYERALRPLQAELVNLQTWVKQTGARAMVVFEGRDAAGKGGCIKAISERVSPRVFRIVALPAPTEREKSQMYLQRYVEHFPAAGEIALFDEPGTTARESSMCWVLHRRAVSGLPAHYPRDRTRRGPSPGSCSSSIGSR